MIEFKQIVGRGTRLFEGKAFLRFTTLLMHTTILLTWNGMATPSRLSHVFVVAKSLASVKNSRQKAVKQCGQQPCVCEKESKKPCEKCGKRPCECVKKVIVKLSDGREREIQHMIATSFKTASPSQQKSLCAVFLVNFPNFFTSKRS